MVDTVIPRGISINASFRHTVGPEAYRVIPPRHEDSTTILFVVLPAESLWPTKHVQPRRCRERCPSWHSKRKSFFEALFSFNHIVTTELNRLYFSQLESEAQSTTDTYGYLQNDLN